MSTKKQTITVSQAKNQVNTFGLSLLIYICLIQTVWHGNAILSRYRPDFFGSADAVLITMFFTMFMMLFTAFILFPISAKQLRLEIRDYLQKVRLRPGRVVVLCAIGIAVYVLVGVLGSLLSVLHQDVTSSYSFVGDFTGGQNILRNIVYFIQFVIVKPWCDEYIFRGVIQRQLGHYSRYFGVLASAVLYALAQPTVIDALIAFFLGWYLAIVSLRYHSIRPCLTVHYAVVLFSWIMSVIPQRYAWISVIMVIAVYLIAGFALLGRHVSTSLVKISRGEKKLWKIVFTSFTVILCIAVFVLGNFLSLFGL